MSESSSLFPSSLIELSKYELQNVSSSSRSSEVSEERKKSRKQRTKNRKIKKTKREDVEAIVQDDESENREEIELPEVKPESSVKRGLASANPAFWHEDERSQRSASFSSSPSRDFSSPTNSKAIHQVSVHRENYSETGSDTPIGSTDEADHPVPRPEERKRFNLSIDIHSTDLAQERLMQKLGVAVALYNTEKREYLEDIQEKSPFRSTEISGLSQMYSSHDIPKIHFKVDISEDDSKNLIVLFGMFEPSEKSRTKQDKGIAWAFLRLVSRSGIHHLSSKLRLQLFRVPSNGLYRSFHNAASTLDNMHLWYEKGERSKLSSTLYVSVNSVAVEIQENQSLDALTTADVVDATTVQQQEDAPVVCSPFSRKRLPGQQFLIAKNKTFSLSYKVGCLMVRYSPEGSALACGFTDGVVQVVNSTTGRIMRRFSGHSGNIYELQWSSQSEGQYLLSAGADCTSRVWDMQQSTCVTLGHPSFVYGAKFKPGTCSVILTACFDGVLRLWTVAKQQPRLVGSFIKHEAPVFCVLWNTDGTIVYSGDSNGYVIVWKYQDHTLQYVRSIDSVSGRKVPVNWITNHPQSQRIIIHTRDSRLHAVEPQSGLTLATYSGSHNSRYRITSAVSPCGTYVVAGSEDGSLYWFDTFTASPAGILTLSKASVITCVDVHPSENRIAVATLEGFYAVLAFDNSKNKEASSDFSFVSFPRAVRSADEDPERHVKGEGKNPTPALDKFQSILKKLHIVQSWFPEAS